MVVFPKPLDGSGVVGLIGEIYEIGAFRSRR